MWAESTACPERYKRPVTPPGPDRLRRHGDKRDRTHRHPKKPLGTRRLAAGRELRPARRLQLSRARRPRRLDRLAHLPRYDSDALFARLLDPDAGHWSIRPVGAYRAERRYLPGTLVIETTFTTDAGQVKLTDCDGLRGGQRGHDLGFDAPHELLRSVEGVSGRVERLELAPRPQYGLVMPLIRLEDGGARTRSARAASGCAPVRRSSLRIRRCAPPSRSPRAAPWLLGPLGVRRGQGRPGANCAGCRCGARRRHRRGVALVGGRARHLRRAAPRARAHELAGAEGLGIPADRRDRRRADHFAPETVGGERNWDYRFSWIRDSSLTIEALYIGTCSDEAEEFVSFMTSSAGGRAGGLAADHVRHRRRARPPGTELPHLRGWCESTPVRVGNYWDQVQLDVYGELLVTLAVPREARRAASRDPGLRGRSRRHRRAPLDRDRLGHVGDARRATPPPVLEGALLDGARPRREARAAARRLCQDRGVGGRARRDPRRRARAIGARKQAFAQSFDSDGSTPPSSSCRSSASCRPPTSACARR